MAASSVLAVSLDGHLFGFIKKIIEQVLRRRLFLTWSVAPPARCLATPSRAAVPALHLTHAAPPISLMFRQICHDTQPGTHRGPGSRHTSGKARPRPRAPRP